MSKELKIKGALGNDFQQIYIDDEPTNLFINKEGRIKTATIKDSVDGSQVDILGDNLTVPTNVKAKDGDHLQLSSTGDVTLTAGASTRNIMFYNEDILQGVIGNRGLYMDTSIYKKESVASSADSAGYGQIWVKATTPNELYFTTDAGDDIQLTSGTGIASGTPQYHYDIKSMGFNASSTTGHYLPITGYILERTSTGNMNEYIGMITPYDCTVEKFAFRSEVPQDGTASFRILESSDDTEVPGTLIYRKDVTIDIADDTYYEWDLTSPSVGSVPIQLTKGRIYAFYIATPSAPFDTNVTIVFKWDVTS